MTKGHHEMSTGLMISWARTHKPETQIYDKTNTDCCHVGRDVWTARSTQLYQSPVAWLIITWKIQHEAEFFNMPNQRICLIKDTSSHSRVLLAIPNNSSQNTFATQILNPTSFQSLIPNSVQFSLLEEFPKAQFELVKTLEWIIVMLNLQISTRNIEKNCTGNNWR